jgi:hypothetical protein
MRTLLFTSFLITSLAGGGLAKTASISQPITAKLIGDLPAPNPRSKKCPLIADLPAPNPRSKKCPLVADLPAPNPRSKKCPLRAA